MRSQVTQVSFSGGELSPHLLDRIDLDSYYAGAAKLENFLPLPHGPLLRRQGSQFIYEAASPGSRLIPFTFSANQTFIIEVAPATVGGGSNGILRFYYKDGIIVKDDGTPYTVSHGWLAEDVLNLNWAQRGDILYVTEPHLGPFTITRYANNDWRIASFATGMTGKPAEWVTNNFPKLVCLFEQRLFFASTPSQPQQVWASKTGIYNNFTIGTNDDDAFSYIISANDANGLQWVVASTALIMGTAGAEFKMSSSSSIDAISPKSVRVDVQTHYGSAGIRPVHIGSNIVFAQRSRNRMRAFEYTFSEDQYTAADITIFADHILRGRAKAMDVQTAPDSYIWIVDDQGDLIGCTYEKAQKIQAWHKHTTNGKFKSICVLPTTEDDQIWVVVERVVNGGTKYFVEVFKALWASTDKVEDSFYVDSGLTYRGNPVQQLTGLQHLNGATVQVLVDGWIHPDVTVVNGGIRLDKPGSIVTVGLGYESTFISVIPQAQDQVTVGATRRIYEITIALEQSLNYLYGQVGGKMTRAQMGPTKIMNKAQELFTGHRKEKIEGDSSITAQLQITQDLQLPLTIRGLVYVITPNKI